MSNADSFINWLVDILVAKEIIAEEDRVVYSFGLTQACIKAVNIVILIISGVILKMWGELLLFLLAYMPLRRYAGGYHAKTVLRCEVLSFALAILSVLTIVNFPIERITPVMAVPGTVVLCIAPIDNEDKPLDSAEAIIAQKKVRAILIFHWVILIIGSVIKAPILCTSIVVAHILMSVFLLLGYLKKCIHHAKWIGGQPRCE